MMGIEVSTEHAACGLTELQVFLELLAVGSGEEEGLHSSALNVWGVVSRRWLET